MHEILHTDSPEVQRLKKHIEALERHYDSIIAEQQKELDFYHSRYPNLRYAYENYCSENDFFEY